MRLRSIWERVGFPFSAAPRVVIAGVRERLVVIGRDAIGSGTLAFWLDRSGDTDQQLTRLPLSFVTDAQVNRCEAQLLLTGGSTDEHELMTMAVDEQLATHWSCSLRVQRAPTVSPRLCATNTGEAFMIWAVAATISVARVTSEGCQLMAEYELQDPVREIAVGAGAPQLRVAKTGAD
jgi:hypothetical protein